MNNETDLHIPHASTVIPKRYLLSFHEEKLRHETDVMTDWFCDELFECGRDKLVFPVSRLVCDVERFRDDKDEIMAKIGMGVTYKNGSDMTPLRKVTKKDRQKILTGYYDLHHKAFDESVTKKLELFGMCLITDCHSFASEPLPYEIRKDAARPDFCIGTSDFHTPVEVTEALSSLLTKSGFSVMENFPFEGTIVPMKFYQKDRRVVSVMIEVNRKLYLDAPGVKNSRFSEINNILRECVELTEKTIHALKPNHF